MTEEHTPAPIPAQAPEAPPEPMPEALPADPSAAVPPPPFPPSAPAPLPPVKKDRRVLRAVLRWTAATVVFAAVGTSAAYGITQMKRTDVPGLATHSDGRWDYPEIVRPPLPSGSPGPFADRNTSASHYADLRKLVLAAPKGAKTDKALAGKEGWLDTKTFLAEYASAGDRNEIQDTLRDRALRHIAARGWTMPDGTRTRIYLLQFDTGTMAGQVQEEQFSGYDAPPHALRGAPAMHLDESFPDSSDSSRVLHYAYVEPKPYGAEQVRQAVLFAGDVIGVVVQSRKGGAKAVPFQQTVVLEKQLLG
ncbi:hypothetical protein [Streptomyces sp. L2]|uniref:hypothetical protein n=1 Tax=Streptomyces sp. L2 TaxID=2162665 RepID=UPI001F511896|nr:hypothetical protein [Streptomyces sp. L2]